ncbi:hypothetical protein H7K45_02070 [Mycobacterium yunnanensis]|uniref:Uncharacterized protein n=1 Tax=Mycobacterium yunnanensis TaxID=368477 RepID=A0A9X3BZX6_9MYCO|nr:hypothetical protein [Mycobacterium yunnanensis]MCV7419316.1 hypothetical protein [Mycobacterium yunnanensis]
MGSRTVGETTQEFDEETRHSNSFAVPQRQTIRHPSLWVWFTAAFVAAAAICVVSVLAVRTTSSKGDVADPPISPAPTPLLDDWESSVCELGTLRDFNGTLRNATDLQACSAARGGTDISIGKYTSNLLLDNDLALWKGRGYATLATDDGTWVFLELDVGHVALSPLMKYGFHVREVS